MFYEPLIEGLPDWVKKPLKVTGEYYSYFEDWHNANQALIGNAVTEGYLDLSLLPAIAYNLGVKKAHHPFNQACLNGVGFIETHHEEPWFNDLMIQCAIRDYESAARVSLDNGLGEDFCHSGLDPECPLFVAIHAERCRRN